MSEREKYSLKLEIGHIAEQIGEFDEKKPDQPTHKWKLFVRVANNGQSDVIDRVTFCLHQSFQNWERVATKPPFETSDTAYGGFPTQIFIYLKHNKREFTVEYDMNFKYVSKDEQKITKVFNFVDPAPDFKALLLKAGATCSSSAAKQKPKPTQFESLFGEVLLPSSSKTAPVAKPSNSSTNPPAAVNTSNGKKASNAPLTVSGKPKAAFDASRKLDSTQKSSHAGGSSQSSDSKPKPTDLSKTSHSTSKPGTSDPKSGTGDGKSGTGDPKSGTGDGKPVPIATSSKVSSKSDRNRDENSVVLQSEKKRAGDGIEEDRSISKKKLKKMKNEEDSGQNSKSEAIAGAGSGDGTSNLKRKKTETKEKIDQREKRIKEMVALQEKIMFCVDKKIQRKIVNIISNLPDSTKFKISESDKMLDFDLFALDQKTVDQLWACFKNN